MGKFSGILPVILMTFLFTACDKDDSAPSDNIPSGQLYFPPAGASSAWADTSIAAMGWDTTRLNDLYGYLQSKGSKAFIILKNGKIACEWYFGNFTKDSLWYWASAGKTLTGFLTGIAQEEGLLDINDPTSLYIGTGWTNAPIARENLITIKNQLSMTSGLDDGVPDLYCVLPSCLNYLADAGTRWAYHNGPYTLLDRVIQNASGMNYNLYFRQKIRDRIGMNGQWIKLPDSNNVYFSNARSMARFGLLMLNRGQWDTTAILRDTAYFNRQVSSSQNLNKSYGYLTWLNGKASYMVPGYQTVLGGSLIANAPADMFAALGKNDQKLYVVPSSGLVIIRMGNDAGGFQPALSGFDNELWAKIKLLIRL